MEFQKVLEERRTIRRFKTRDIAEEKVTALLEAARLSVSALNRQPWRFMFLKGEEKDAISDIMAMLGEANNIELPNFACRSRLASLAIQQAPLLVLVFMERNEECFVGDLLSIGASLENISLKAVDLGLSTMWMREIKYSEEKIKKYVGIKDLELLSAMAIGYADEVPLPQSRKDLSSLLVEPKISPSRNV